MPSRVIHVRLDDWVLLGCHDVMKAQGDAVKGIPMATIVRQLLTALIRKLQSTEQIPIYGKEELVQRAMELYEGAIELDMDLGLEDFASIENKEVEVDTEMIDLVKQTLANINKEGEPEGLSTEVKISEADDIPPAPIMTTNILEAESDAFIDFLVEAPMDRFVEWASEKNEVVQKAVAITYTGLPRNLWGSEKAEGMIKGLLERHRE